MRFLVDENVSPLLRRAMVDRGHDVAAFDLGGEDADVLAFAVRDRRILVTFDSDFGELIFREALPAPPGIIFVRFFPRPPDEPGDVWQRMFESGLEFEGQFTVVDRATIRQRPLPHPR